MATIFPQGQSSASQQIEQQRQQLATQRTQAELMQRQLIPTQAQLRGQPGLPGLQQRQQMQVQRGQVGEYLTKLGEASTQFEQDVTQYQKDLAEQQVAEQQYQAASSKQNAYSEGFNLAIQDMATGGTTYLAGSSPDLIAGYKDAQKAVASEQSRYGTYQTAIDYGTPTEQAKGIAEKSAVEAQLIKQLARQNPDLNAGELLDLARQQGLMPTPTGAVPQLKFTTTDQGLMYERIPPPSPFDVSVPKSFEIQPKSYMPAELKAADVSQYRFGIFDPRYLAQAGKAFWQRAPAATITAYETLPPYYAKKVSTTFQRVFPEGITIKEGKEVPIYQKVTGRETLQYTPFLEPIKERNIGISKVAPLAITPKGVETATTLGLYVAPWFVPGGGYIIGGAYGIEAGRAVKSREYGKAASYGATALMGAVPLFKGKAQTILATGLGLGFIGYGGKQYLTATTPDQRTAGLINIGVGIAPFALMGGRYAKQKTFDLRFGREKLPEPKPLSKFSEKQAGVNVESPYIRIERTKKGTTFERTAEMKGKAELITPGFRTVAYRPYQKYFGLKYTYEGIPTSYEYTNIFGKKIAVSREKALQEYQNIKKILSKQIVTSQGIPLPQASRQAAAYLRFQPPKDILTASVGMAKVVSDTEAVKYMILGGQIRAQPRRVIEIPGKKAISFVTRGKKIQPTSEFEFGELVKTKPSPEGAGEIGTKDYFKAYGEEIQLWKPEGKRTKRYVRAIEVTKKAGIPIGEEGIVDLFPFSKKLLYKGKEYGFDRFSNREVGVDVTMPRIGRTKLVAYGLEKHFAAKGFKVGKFVERAPIKFRTSKIPISKPTISDVFVITPKTKGMEIKDWLTGERKLITREGIVTEKLPYIEETADFFKRAKIKPKPFSEDIVKLYHGTTSTSAKGILAKGLKPAKEVGISRGLPIKLPEVFATPELARAEGWAGRAVFGKGKPLPGEIPKVLEINLPKSKYEKLFVRRSMEKGGGVEVALKRVPAKYIKEVSAFPTRVASAEVTVTSSGQQLVQPLKISGLSKVNERVFKEVSARAKSILQKPIKAPKVFEGRGLPKMVGGTGLLLSPRVVMARPLMFSEVEYLNQPWLGSSKISKEKISIIQLPKTLSLIKMDQRLNVLTAEKLGLKLNAQMDLRLGEKVELKLEQLPALNLGQEMNLRLGERLGIQTRTDMRQRINQTTGLRSVPEIILTPKPRKPTKIIIPRLGKKRLYPRTEKLSGKGKETGYTFQLKLGRKLGGKYLPTAPISVTKEEAFALGAAQTMRKAQATFKITPTGRAARPMGIRPTPIQRAVFRPGKAAGSFVQKERLRILSAGEKREITYKGIAARRAGIGNRGSRSKTRWGF